MILLALLTSTMFWVTCACVMTQSKVEAPGVLIALATLMACLHATALIKIIVAEFKPNSKPPTKQRGINQPYFHQRSGE